MWKIKQEKATCGLWLAFFWAAWLPSLSSHAGSFPSRYDEEIKAAVSKRWADLPYWKLWKAQLYQESRLDPLAVSPVGARGLAQFMPATWRDIAKELGVTAGPESVAAVDAGAYYMAKLRRTWRRERTAQQQNELAQASYNAGTGNVLKAQAACADARMWPEIAPCFAAITGDQNARETLGYVKSIRRWWLMLEGGM